MVGIGTLMRKLMPLGAIMLALLVAGLVLVRLEVVDVSIPGIHSLLRESGRSAPAIFLALCALRGLFFIPVGTFTVAAGLMFGVSRGILLALAGVAISSVIPFTIARRLGSRWVREVLADERNDPRFPAAVSLLRRRGFWGIALLRTMPFPPFDVISYITGVLRIRIAAFVAGTTIGSIPGVVILGYLGAELKNPLRPALFALLGFFVVELAVGYLLARRFLAGNARPGNGDATSTERNAPDS